MKYCIVQGESNSIDEALRQLDIKVNNKLQKGWKLQGGVSIIGKTYHHCCACQAMVKDGKQSRKSNN